MADEVQATPEQVEEARSMGWCPKEEWRGDQARWVDAPAFLQKAETFIPFLRQDRQRLQGEVSTLKNENSRLNGELGSLKESVEGLKEYNSQTRTAQLESEIKDLRVQLAEARKEGDVNAEADLEERLDTRRDELKEVKAEGTRSTGGNGQGNGQGNGAGGNGQGNGQPQDFTQAPEFRQFMQDNPWFETDPVMAAASTAIMQELSRTDPGFKTMTPAQRFNKTAELTRKRFGLDDQPRGSSRVEGGGRGSGNAGGGSSSGKSYSDLPSDARAACDRFSSKMVGKGKAFATEADWQKKYASDYFNS